MMLDMIEWNWWMYLFPLTGLGYPHDNKVAIGFTNATLWKIKEQRVLNIEMAMFSNIYYL